MKNKVKTEMRRGGKEVGFQGGAYSLKTIDMFLLDIYKNLFYEKEFNFSKQNTHKLKDIGLLKVLWTAY